MAVEWKKIAFADDLHAAVTIDGTSPLSLSGQAISLKNDAAAAITEVDTGTLANSDTVIPTSKAVLTKCGLYLPLATGGTITADVVLSRGSAVNGIVRALTIGGARTASGNDYAQLNFVNYDGADYTGARISSQNDGGVSDGDLRFYIADAGSLGADPALRIDSTGNAHFTGTINGRLTGNVTGNCSGNSGSCTGNAATATKLATTRAITIGSKANNFDGSDAITFALADVGAAAVNQTMYIGTTAVAINRGSAALTLAGITLTNPNIGTPSAGTLTNCTGYPESLVGDGTPGRVLRVCAITITKGTDSGTIKVALTNRWNGDARSGVDNIAPGSTGTYWSLNAGATMLTMEDATITGSAIGALPAIVFYNTTGAVITTYTVVRYGDIDFYFYNASSGTVADIATLVSPGKEIWVHFAYITSA